MPHTKPISRDEATTPPRGLSALSGDALEAITANPATALPMIAVDLKRISQQLEEDRKRLAHAEHGVITAIQQSAAAVTRVGDVGFSVTEEWGQLKDALSALQQCVVATNANVSALTGSIEQLNTRLSAFEVRLAKAEQSASLALASAEAAEDWAERSGQFSAANVEELKRRASRGDEFIERLALKISDIQIEHKRVDVEEERARVDVGVDRAKTKTRTIAAVAVALFGTGGLLTIILLAIVRGCQPAAHNPPTLTPAAATVSVSAVP